MTFQLAQLKTTVCDDLNLRKITARWFRALQKGVNSELHALSPSDYQNAFESCHRPLELCMQSRGESSETMSMQKVNQTATFCFTDLQTSPNKQPSYKQFKRHKDKQQDLHSMLAHMHANTYTHMDTHSHAYVHMHTRTHTCMHMHTHTHTTHTHTHTHTPTHTRTHKHPPHSTQLK